MRWREHAAPVVAGVLGGALLGLALLGYLATQSPTYQARVSLLAVPVDAASNQPGVDYASVVTLTLPSVIEFAGTDSVVENAAAAAGVDVAPEDVSVAVEIVPASGLARVTVDAPTEAAASSAADSVVSQIVRADLMAPVAKMRRLDPPPAQATEVTPQLTRTVGLALLAAVLTGVMISFGVAVFRPRISSARQAAAAINDLGLRGVTPVIDSEDEGALEELASLAALQPSRRVVLMPAGGMDEGSAHALAASLNALRTSGGPLASRLSGARPIYVLDGGADGQDVAHALVIVTVKRAVTSPDVLRNTVALLTRGQVPVMAITIV